MHSCTGKLLSKVWGPCGTMTNQMTNQTKLTISCEAANYFYSSYFMTLIRCWPTSSCPQGIRGVMCKQIMSNGIFCPVGMAWHGQRSVISISACPPTVSTYRLYHLLLPSLLLILTLSSKQYKRLDWAAWRGDNMAESNPVERREIKRGRLRQSRQWQDSLPCLFFPC